MSLSNELESSSLVEAASLVARSIRESLADLYVIVTHYDADGLAAASIIARALTKLDRQFVVRVVDQVDEEVLGCLPRGQFYIFTDLGSTMIDAIAKKSLTPACIIDHHEPLRETSPTDEIQELNPHNFGINGGREVSASGLAYLVSKSMGFVDHLTAYLAIAGAVGDRQEHGTRGLVGINDAILQESIGKGWVRKTMGLRLYGVPRQSLVKSLMYTVDPILPGLTYEETACQRFLETLGISTKKSNGSPRSYKDLSPHEISKLATALIKHLLVKGFTPQIADSLFGCMYEFLNEPEDSPLRYAHEFAQTLNACGRLRRHSIGIMIGLGFRESVLNIAEALSLEYRRRLAQYLSLVRNNPSCIRSFNNIQVVDAKDIVDERILGALSSIMLSSHMCDITKPLIALANSLKKGKIKVSARMHESLVKRGVDLGLIVKLAAEKVGGAGGGHEAAAGGIVPMNSLEEFIKLVDHLVGKTLKDGALM